MYKTGNYKITDGIINNSYIDMNNQDLINIRDPVNPQDAVPKWYVDDIVTPGGPVTFPTLTFTLTGTNATSIIGSTVGSYTLSITSSSTGAPMAKFELLKNDPTKNASITRKMSSCGINTKERLNCTWNPAEAIKVYKDGSNYDGTYEVTYIPNF
jgi:hypothetical protein